MEQAALDPNFYLLYVNDPAVSVAFYRDLLAREPVQTSPNFAMFALGAGVMLGLWARHDVQPPASAAAGTTELGFTLPDAAAVDAWHTRWAARGVRILQAPVQMDFGYTFTAADPDGHRLRAFVPNRS